jgi:uncharacterized protein YtpQ (UPF0354 family)
MHKGFYDERISMDYCDMWLGAIISGYEVQTHKVIVDMIFYIEELLLQVFGSYNTLQYSSSKRFFSDNYGEFTVKWWWETKVP